MLEQRPSGVHIYIDRRSEALVVSAGSLSEDTARSYCSHGARPEGMLRPVSNPPPVGRGGRRGCLRV